jgi:aryl-alcohol dehydrogenase-like predicted oxidoreductase/histidinol phosphatase-like enzyme/predicted kinase
MAGDRSRHGILPVLHAEVVTAFSPGAGGSPRIAFGAMRLSTDSGRDDERSIQVLRAAFDAGITLVDTSDAYCLDAGEAGHNERLIARAIASWTGDRSWIRVATKGGLTRPNGLWIPDGRARHLTAACEASRRALGVERIHLYQLHAVDPRTPLATSMRALSALRRDGAVEGIGLCNVTVGQIEEARAIDEIAAVQVELNPWKDESVLNGVARYCVEHNIALLAHRPLGGPARSRRIAADPVLAEVAAKHHATPFEIVLAWLQGLSPLIVPVPGATRVETAQSIARAVRIALDDDDRARLHAALPTGRAWLPASRSVRLQQDQIPADLVLIMGLPAAGKSTLAESFVGRGYARLNRDASGGSLADLLPALDRLVAAGASRIVLDNTYVSRESRARVIRAAAERGLPVRCVSLETSVEDAQINAVHRMIATYGRLLTPQELRGPRRGAPRDVSAFGPSVQFRYQRELEPPDPSEGFSIIERVPFVRRRDPAFVNKAVLLWCDGVLRRSRSGARAPTSPDDVELLPRVSEVLRRYAADGWTLLGISWQPEVADRTLRAGDVDAVNARTAELAGVSIEFAYCPHPAGPPICWCRKPLPGLAVAFIERHRLDPALCLYVGAGAQDPGFSARLGFQYRQAEEFFGRSGYDRTA